MRSFGQELRVLSNLPLIASVLPATSRPILTSSHFSQLCDCLVIPRWHGTDEEGTLFLDHFRRLNRRGLFDERQEAEDFQEYYLSFDWRERDICDIVEVFLPADRL